MLLAVPVHRNIHIPWFMLCMFRWRGQGHGRCGSFTTVLGHLGCNPGNWNSTALPQSAVGTALCSVDGKPIYWSQTLHRGGLIHSDWVMAHVQGRGLWAEGHEDGARRSRDVPESTAKALKVSSYILTAASCLLPWERNLAAHSAFHDLGLFIS